VNTLNYLRIGRDSSQSPGTWAGSVVRTGPEGTFVLTSQEKWDKAKAQIQEIEDMLARDPTKLNHKRLEQIHGFLQYAVQTYTSFTSYLIGMHMTIDSWQDRGMSWTSQTKIGEALWTLGRKNHLLR
jgi:hypothetical protein